MPDSNRSEFKSGECPPEGVYVCMKCGEHTIIVPEMERELPKCKHCNGTRWLKV